MGEESAESILDRLHRLQTFLGEERGHIEPKITNPNALTPISSGMAFAHQTIQSLILLLDGNLGLQMAILARSLFETACQLRWASLAKNGWIRLFCQECSGLLKDESSLRQHIEDLPAFPELVKKYADEVRSKRVDTCPASFKSLLEEIVALEASEGQRVSPIGNDNFQYDVTYGMLSRYAHGRILQINTSPIDAAGIASINASEAVIILLMAAYRSAQEPYRDMHRRCLNLFPPEI